MLEPRAYSYFAYRYLLIQESAQLTFFQQERPKEQLMVDVLEKLKRERKLSAQRRGRKHLLYFAGNPYPGVFVGKLAKERRYTKHDEGTIDVEEVPDHEYPFVTFVVDIPRQLVLIQRRTSVFAEPDSARAALEDTVQSVGEFGRFGLVLTEITPEEQFWDFVHSSEGIYQLDLTLHAPNLFNGLYKGDEIAKKVQEVYGSTETTFVMRNERGGLIVAKEVLGDIVRFISVGGGRYLLRLKKQGEQIVQTITSSMNTVAVWIRGEAENLALDQVMERLAEVNAAHDKNKQQSKNDGAQ